MTKAEHYREQHKKLMNKEKQEESLPVACLELMLIILGAMSWVASLFILAS
ncbi:MAG: hypothetical protein WBI17_07150 [Clostridiaceae bacterium]